jgi:hypothetical protein
MYEEIEEKQIAPSAFRGILPFLISIVEKPAPGKADCF